MTHGPGALGAFRDYLQSEGLAPATVDIYLAHVKSYLDFLRHNGYEPSEQTVRLWIVEPGQPRGHSSIGQRYGALRMYYGRFRGEADPTIRIRRPRRGRHLPRPVA